MEDCIFCKIAAGDIPATRVYEDEYILAFPDIQPQRPVHILVIPKCHIPSLAHAGPGDEALLGRMLAVAYRIAADQGSPDGFRVIVNTGEIGGQEVMHLHMHIVGGQDPIGPMLKHQ